MKGFAYLDIDGNLCLKNYEYITTDNPHFWSQNDHMIVKWWNFDTEDLASMRAMLTQFKGLQLKQHVVEAFLEAIDFDITVLKVNANKVQSG